MGGGTSRPVPCLAVFWEADTAPGAVLGGPETLPRPLCCDASLTRFAKDFSVTGLSLGASAARTFPSCESWTFLFRRSSFSFFDGRGELECCLPLFHGFSTTWNFSLRLQFRQLAQAPGLWRCVRAGQPSMALSCRGTFQCVFLQLRQIRFINLSINSFAANAGQCAKPRPFAVGHGFQSWL